MKVLLLLFFLAASVCADVAFAQPALTFRKLNLESNGYIMTLEAPSLSGDQTFSFPAVPTGSILPGFVQRGDSTKLSLQWDVANNYWKAVAGSGSVGTGIQNRLTRWGTTTSLDTSMIYDDGVHVAINTSDTTTNALLRVNEGSVVFDGTQGYVPEYGTVNPTRMMWLPSRGAFRAGRVEATQWDSAVVGMYSTALGYEVRASGDYSLVTGRGSVATHAYAMAMGFGDTATAVRSVALGSYAHTNFKAGSFVFGDNSIVASVKSSVANQFMVRAVGGVTFYTAVNSSTNQGDWTGAELAAGATSWSVISDSNRKENRLRTNGEEVLGKISNMWLGSWNYKGQDPKEYRHYGPMAQEFYTAFGNDGIGRSGNDTTITSGDFDGINLIAIQALEKRTSTMQSQINEIKQLRAENKELRDQLQELKQIVTTLAQTQQKSVIKEASLK